MKTKKKGRSTYKLSAQEKKDIAILERAAGMVESGQNNLCCAAILDASWDENLIVTSRVRARFKNAMKDHDDDWLGRWWGNGYDRENKEARIFALLFAAEMIRTNSLP